jgi:tetratricopeptide (TPR) repeat protein
VVTPPPSPALGTPQPSRHLTPLPQLDPIELYTLAQRLFSNGDLARAEMAFEAVARADSGNQRVRAFLIWIHFWKSTEAQRAEALELTAKTLRDVMRNEQTFALGHYFVGALAKLQKDVARAEQAFRLALQHDPNLIEAQRELRLMTLRKTQR